MQNAQKMALFVLSYSKAEKMGWLMLALCAMIKPSRGGRRNDTEQLNQKFEVLPMLVEIKLTIKIEHKKKGPAPAAKGKAQSQSKTEIIITQK